MTSRMFGMQKCDRFWVKNAKVGEKFRIGEAGEMGEMGKMEKNVDHRNLSTSRGLMRRVANARKSS